ncbi:MAG: ribosome biogenesis GTPase Der [Rickettsiales bacterium]|nr:ribosome biogenesis GTPase Der [Rickettsiales bacterium]
MSHKVMILGKPNVGKSSIFNMMIGKKMAIENNFPGLTRDIKYKRISAYERNFDLIDSPGIFEPECNLEKKIQNKNNIYLKKSSLLIFVIDGRESLTTEDYNIVRKIRKSGKKILLVLNKSEGNLNKEILNECKKLGFGDPIAISASHNQGIDQLLLAVTEFLPQDQYEDEKIGEFDMSIAIVGKTNSGKSSILNVLKGEEISQTGETPNLTRDSVETFIKKKNIKFKIIDTAGFTKTKIKDNFVDKLSMDITKKKIRLSKFILVVIDIENYYEKLHSKIIKYVYEENRCMFLLINKIDKIDKYSKTDIKKKIYNLNPIISGIPIYFVSAKNKIGFDSLIDDIDSQIDLWTKRISTGKLNSWLEKIMKKNPPPIHRGNAVKLKFIMQVNTGPPKFNVFMNYPEVLKSTYKRYLENNLKRTFGMNGIPLKIIFKKSENPFNEK